MARVQQRFNMLLAGPAEMPEVRVEAEAAGLGPEWARNLLEGLDNAEGSVQALRQAGFLRPEAALSALVNISAERYLPNSLSRYHSRLERLLPAMISGAAATPDPDRAVIHLERFLGRIGPRAGFFVLLEENPRLIKVLSVLFGSSDLLSGILISHPGILDSLIDRRSAQLIKNRETMTEDLSTVLGREDDPEARLGLIRRFRNEEMLRIGLYDLLGELTLAQVQTQLCLLAELIMEATLNVAADLAWPDWNPAGPPIPLAVMGLGRLGGRELFYGSDLDLIFILGRGRVGKATPLEDAVRLAQRMTSYLSMPLSEGPGYKIDARLRPSGRAGGLVVTTNSFARYHQTSALWERQALIKMRPILGPPSLGAWVRHLANQAMFKRELPTDSQAMIHDLRRRMTRERGRIKAGTINIKFSPGGLVDVEFLTQYLQLLHGRSRKGAIRSTSTGKALAGLARQGLGPKRLYEVAAAYELMSRLANRLGLVYARSGDTAAYRPEEIKALSLEPEGADFYGNLRSSMKLVRTVYAEVFETEAGDEGPEPNGHR
jgi:glutamate-ammonia-ligase adenylyltransferase